MAATMTSAQLVSLFLDRADANGVVRLTEKQCKWLRSLVYREYKEEIVRSTILRDVNGSWVKFAVYPNGCGFICPKTK